MSCKLCELRIDEPAGACFSPDRKHRFLLWRNWDRDKPILAVIMLNPSIADEQKLDPTLTRVFKFAKAWGFGGMRILNAFSVVSTDPKGLEGVVLDDTRNDEHIRNVLQGSRRCMVGWGANMERPHLRYRVDELKAMLLKSGVETMAWKITKDGHPSHPLYIAGRTEPMAYPLRGEDDKRADAQGAGQVRGGFRSLAPRPGLLQNRRA